MVGGDNRIERIVDHAQNEVVQHLDDARRSQLRISNLQLQLARKRERKADCHDRREERYRI